VEVQLIIHRETLLVTLDTGTAGLGYVTAVVADDEGNPVQGLAVKFYLEGEFWGSATTDDQGRARLESSQLQPGQTIRAVVEENSYYLSAQDEKQIPPPPPAPPDLTFLLLIVGGLVTLFIAIASIRKYNRSRRRRQRRAEGRRGGQVIPVSPSIPRGVGGVVQADADERLRLLQGARTRSRKPDEQAQGEEGPDSSPSPTRDEDESLNLLLTGGDDSSGGDSEG